MNALKYLNSRLGKTIEQIRGLVAESGQGKTAVIKAGCTINISDFIYAVEQAINSASDSEATTESSLSLKISTVQNGKDATETEDGYNELTAKITANALDKDGKNIASKSAEAEVKYTFNNKGKVNTSN